MSPHFVPVKNKYKIEAALKNKKIPLWLPCDMVLPSTDIPASWDMTYDSLAAWAATQIGARHILLVKACVVPGCELNLSTLALQKIVDPLFPIFVTKGKLAWRMLSARDSLKLSALLSNETAQDYL